MTQILDRPTTEADVRSPVVPRPLEVEREEIRQLPPEGRPPRARLFRWLGWLLGIAAVLALSWFVINEITAEDTPTATPTPITADAVTADPKARTPVVTGEMVADAVRTGQPGDVSLTQLVTLGNNPGPSFEDATVNPMIYWAVQPTYAQMMEEATVSPLIYEAQAAEYARVMENFWLLGNNELLMETLGQIDVTKTAMPGVYWTPRISFEEGALFAEAMELSQGGYWPAYNYPDWSLSTYVYVAPDAPEFSGNFGGSMNLVS